MNEGVYKTGIGLRDIVCIVRGKYMYVWGGVHARAHCYDVYKRGMSVRSAKDLSGLLMAWGARVSSLALTPCLVASFPFFRLSLYLLLLSYRSLNIYFYLCCMSPLSSRFMYLFILFSFLHLSL